MSLFQLGDSCEGVLLRHGRGADALDRVGEGLRAVALNGGSSAEVLQQQSCSPGGILKRSRDPFSRW